ncbi:general secretion pathway protein GspM [Acidovorax sp. HMWF029]|uniref:type II secretion system protein GspM n=1 Tax=unclassified Acidovorax TaxID=2684926 RepID=UPI000D375332|nr:MULTISPECIES: type II secretion system protein GspM [unclassified Acidovorax]MDH4416558.1 type II secretion system protein GspM [Acidovorax sp.]PTT22147.1 general secretion pathway protein GspM [Acidovorax sp. HMWF029]
MQNHKAREIAALAVVFTLLLAPVVAGGIYVFQKHQWAQARLAELEPRYARLLGLDEQRSDISAALAQAKDARARYVYPATQETTVAGNAAQQRVREILSAAGLQISSSQVLPPKAVKGYERIPIAVRAEGEWLAVQSALAVFSTQLPLIVIDEFEVQVLGGLGNTPPKFQPKLAVSFVFSVLREQK